jgi:thiol-disulfide isomerase/thioredoxin
MKVSKKTLMYAAAFLAVVVLAYYLAPMWREGFSGGASFTLYYADWCPHCKSIKPVFAEWSSKKTIEVNGTVVSLDMVEADTDSDKVKAAKVKGFPTFMLKKADGTSVEFSGDRSPSGWESWLGENV